MKERPILFSAPMVIALREDRKTQTRRTRGLGPINEAPDDYTLDGGEYDWRGFTFQHFAGPVTVRCPYGVAGDRLWTRETFCDHDFNLGGNKLYRADGEFLEDWTARGLKWKPAIHMPRSWSRDTLEVVSARPERLQDIKAWECICEGIEGDIGNVVPNFARLWEEINGDGSWAKNPWIWRVEFRRVEK